jgi:hypothetical protein
LALLLSARLMRVFGIADRGEQQIGTFSSAAIADNLRNNIFRQDDWYWSEDGKAWQPLGNLLL